MNLTKLKSKLYLLKILKERTQSQNNYQKSVSNSVITKLKTRFNKESLVGYWYIFIMLFWLSIAIYAFMHITEWGSKTDWQQESRYDWR